MKQAKKGAKNGSGFGAWTRPFVDSIRFEWISLSVLMSPVLAVIGWIVFLVMYQLAVNQKALQTTIRIAQVENAQRIMANFAADVAHTSAQGHVRFREYSVNKTAIAEQETLDALSLILFGGEVWADDDKIAIGRIGSGTYEHSLLLDNACLPWIDEPLEFLQAMAGTPNTTQEDIDAMLQECSTMQNAVLGEGAYGAIIKIVALARRLRANLPDPDYDSPLFTPERIEMHRLMTELE